MQGRFLSQDPTGFAGHDLNLYRYVGNAVLNGTDTSGLLSPTDFVTGTYSTTLMAGTALAAAATPISVAVAGGGTTTVPAMMFGVEMVTTAASSAGVATVAATTAASVAALEATAVAGVLYTEYLAIQLHYYVVVLGMETMRGYQLNLQLEQAQMRLAMQGMVHYMTTIAVAAMMAFVERSVEQIEEDLARVVDEMDEETDKMASIGRDSLEQTLGQGGTPGVTYSLAGSEMYYAELAEQYRRLQQELRAARMRPTPGASGPPNLGTP